jgi:hypothetical protein
MSKIIPLHNASLDENPDPHIIEKLEELLAEAKDGRLRGFAYVATRGDDRPFSHGYISNRGDGHRISTCIMQLMVAYAGVWQDA